jgi:ribonuclease HI
MELTAVAEALRELGRHKEWRALPIVVTTDSQYVQKGITAWIHSWQRNSWRTSANKPVKNVDLWSALWELAKSLSVSWAWVEGHAGNEMNERCHHMVEQSIAGGRPR